MSHYLIHMFVCSEIKDKNEHKRKKTTHTTDSKGIQAGENDNISIDDLISDAGPSENYWQILAEKRG